MKGFPTRCFVLAATAVLCLTTVAFAANTIKVGIVDTYSGPAGVFGVDMRDGFKMGVDAINAKGGVVGRKIEFVSRDEKFKPDIALSMAKELVMKEKVDILMGTISSASALAISDFAKKEKIPFQGVESLNKSRPFLLQFRLPGHPVSRGRDKGNFRF